MIRYIMFLIAAILGRNPFRMELDEMSEKLERTAGDLQKFREKYFDVLEKNGVDLLRLERMREINEDLKRERDDLQVLVENLRERINEKDAEKLQQGRDYQERIENIKRGYQQRIDAYSEELLRYGNKKLTENP